MSKSVYLGLSILDRGKTAMYEIWYDYVKPKYNEKAKPFYMDTESFIVHVQTDDIQKDIAEDVKTRFDTSNYELGKPFSKGKSKKSTGLMKDELGGKIMTYSYLIDQIVKIEKQKAQISV